MCWRWRPAALSFALAGENKPARNDERNFQAKNAIPVVLGLTSRTTIKERSSENVYFCIVGGFGIYEEILLATFSSR